MLLLVTLSLAVAVTLSVSFGPLFVALRASTARDAQPNIFVLTRCLLVYSFSFAAARRRIEDGLCDWRRQRIVFIKRLYPRRCFVGALV
jgi:hypothetical protein